MPTTRIHRRGPNQKLRGCRKPTMTKAEKAEGERLRVACVIANISRYDLAEVIGLSPQTCGKWLAQQCELRPEYQAKVKARWRL